MGAYLAQVWDGERKLSETEDLPLDEARRIAQDAPGQGLTGRIMAMGRDYVEVYDPERGLRTGTFGETTLVQMPRPVGPWTFLERTAGSDD